MSCISRDKGFLTSKHDFSVNLTLWLDANNSDCLCVCIYVCCVPVICELSVRSNPLYSSEIKGFLKEMAYTEINVVKIWL